MKKIAQAFANAAKRLIFIDYVFIAIFAIIVIGFFLFFKRKTVYIPVTFKVADETSLYGQGPVPKIAFAQSFVVGDTEKNELGQPVATITNIDSYNLSANNQVIFVTANVKAIYNPRKKQYTIKSRPVTYGTSIPFIFNNVTFVGLVVNFPDFETTQQITRGATRVRAQLRQESREFSEVSGVPSYIANAVKAGDRINNSNNEPMAVIQSVEIKPATRTVVTSGGGIMNVLDPGLFDVFYTIDLMTKRINDKTYMFDYFPVGIGEIIPLNFSTISVYPTIVEVIKQE